MTPCLSAEDVARVLAGDLPEETAGLVRSHLLICEHCRSVLDRATDDPSLRQWASRAVGPSPTPLEGPALDRFLGQLGTSRKGEAPAEPSWPKMPGFAIQGVLGQGGMGVVYQAEQLSLKRLVALKMIRLPGRADPREMARFRLEAEAAARLRNPNIVHVYEVGEHQGRPYLSLELVEGGSLAQKLNRLPQPPREAALLVQVLAQAMHCAHEAGIIHRDLKPANVLLTRGGQPKITDFGLAKCLDADTGQTRSGTILGTPGYMAPEQARGRSGRAGPTTDVYALGAILYEMLTGRPPFVGEDVLETLRQVTTQEPVPPRRLRPGLPRDLETICLKALAKEPAGRYASAQDLADDLGRFGRGEPIRARPPGWLGRSWRWCRRNPWVAGLSSSLALALLGGVIGILWQAKLALDFAHQADKQRLRAEESLKEADDRLSDACHAVDDFLTRVSEEDLFAQPNARPLRKKLLERALGFLTSFLDARGDHPSLKRQVAQAWLRVGNIKAELGPADQAELAFREAIARFDELARLEPTSTSIKHHLAEAHLHLGLLLQQTGRRSEALEAFRQATTQCEHQGETGPGLRDPFRANLAACYGNLANLYYEMGQRVEALRNYEKAQAVLEQLLREDPEDKGLQKQLALNFNNQALFQEPRQALESLRQARAIRQRMADSNPQDGMSRRDLARTDQNLAIFYEQTGQPKEAERHHRQAAAGLEEVVKENRAVVLFRRDLAQAWLNLGAWQGNQRQFAEAAGSFSRARDLLQELVKEEPAFEYTRYLLALTLCQLGGSYLRVNRPTEAMPYIQEGLTLRQQLWQAAPELLPKRYELGMAWMDCGEALYQLGRHPEALDALRQGVVHQRFVLDKEPATAGYRAQLNRQLAHLAQRLRQCGRVTESAEVTLQRQLLYPDKGQELFQAACELGACLKQLGREPASAAADNEARRYADQAIANLRRALALEPGLRPQIASHPDFEALRDHPQFQALLPSSGTPTPGLR
jgi:serine/threonine-protein kinase